MSARPYYTAKRLVRIPWGIVNQCHSSCLMRWRKRAASASVHEGEVAVPLRPDRAHSDQLLFFHRPPNQRVA